MKFYTISFFSADYGDPSNFNKRTTFRDQPQKPPPHLAPKRLMMGPRYLTRLGYFVEYGCIEVMSISCSLEGYRCEKLEAGNPREGIWSESNATAGMIFNTSAYYGRAKRLHVTRMS